MGVHWVNDRSMIHSVMYHWTIIGSMYHSMIVYSVTKMIVQWYVQQCTIGSLCQWSFNVPFPGPGFKTNRLTPAPQNIYSKLLMSTSESFFSILGCWGQSVGLEKKMIFQSTYILCRVIKSLLDFFLCRPHPLLRWKKGRKNDSKSLMRDFE